MDLTGSEQGIRGHRSDQRNTEDSRELIRLDDLPNELLIHIFIKGCEEPTSDDDPPCSRRLKKFAHVASQVDQRWRKLIHMNSSFWISRILLKFDAIKDKDAFKLSFVKSLMDFRRQLLTSDGCDLAIHFHFSVRFNRDEIIPGIDALPRPISIAIRFLLHSMEAMVPYYRQITLLRVESAHPQVYLHLLEIVNARWDAAPRLFELSFGSTRWWYPTRPITDFIIEPDLGFGGVLQTRSPIPSSGPAMFSHLRSLDTLEVPDCSWLNEETQLPRSLSRLVIATAGPETIPVLHRFLMAQHVLCEHIKSVVMGIEGHEHIQQKQEQDDWKTSSQIILPRLRSISLSGVVSQHARLFIGSSTLPLLEEISLTRLDHGIRGYRTITGKEEPALDPIFTSGGTEQDMPLYGYKALPSLRKLTLVMDWLSFHPLACISILTINSIDTLSISIDDDDSDTSHLSNRFGSLFAHILSKFQPRHLLSDYVSYEVIQFILRSVDTRMTESVSIRARYSKKDSIELVDRPPCLQFRPDQWVSIPRLANLQLTAHDETGVHFLLHLHAKNLERLDLSIVDGRYWRKRKTWKQRKTKNVLLWTHETAHEHTTPNPLSSVRFVKYNLRLSDVHSPLHWQLLPDVEELEIHISSYTTSSNVLKKPYDSLTKFLAGLKPTISGSVPFPRVRTLLVSSQDFIPRGSSDPELATPSIEPLHLAINRLLKSRQIFNRAIPLHLDDLPRISLESYDPLYYGGILKFSFRAVVHNDSLVAIPQYRSQGRIGPLKGLVRNVKSRYVDARRHEDSGLTDRNE